MNQADITNITALVVALVSLIGAIAAFWHSVSTQKLVVTHIAAHAKLILQDTMRVVETIHSTEHPEPPTGEGPTEGIHG